MKKRSVLFSFLLFFSLAQAGISLDHSSSFRITVGYFGELLTHPGICVGTEYNVKEGEFVSTHWDMDMGFYSHPLVESAGFLSSSIGMLAQFPLGLFLDMEAGVGIIYSFPPGDASASSASSGQTYFMPSLGFDLGWSGNYSPLSVALGPFVYMESNFTSTWQPHLALRVRFALALASGKE